MAPSMKPGDWVDFIEREYLDTFISEGGAAIKFAVPLDDESRHLVTERLDASASTSGYLTATISAADTRVHMMDQLFFCISEQINWQDLCERVVIRLAREEQYTEPPDGPAPLLQRIARENGVEPELLMGHLRRKIQQIFRYRKMSKDFRVAMSQLCLAQLTAGSESDTMTLALTDWLTGRNPAVAAVKPYLIFSRINRTNARHAFESLLRWIRFAGYQGIVIVLDTARLTISKNPRDEHRFYTKAQLLDAYEVMRQFIDGTDRLRGCLIVIVPDIAFLDDEIGGRGIGAYDALKFRVFDEVRDKTMVNPMASLVRLSEFAEAPIASADPVAGEQLAGGPSSE